MTDAGRGCHLRKSRFREGADIFGQMTLTCSWEVNLIHRMCEILHNANHLMPS